MVNRFGSWRLMLGVLATGLLLSLSPLAWAVPGALQIEPSNIAIGIFYGGTRLSVSGEIPKGCDAVIEVLGKTSEEDLMRKGKRWELWMNVGEVDVQGAPSLYLVKSNAAGEVVGSGPDAQWSYQALEKKISFGTKIKMSNGKELFREFIRLKKSQGVYGVVPKDVTLTPSGPDLNTARAVFSIPTRVAPGTYRVCLFAVRDGQVVQQQCAPLQVRMIGFPAFLSSMARTRGVLYGFMAVLIAMAAGLLTGVIFKKKGGHH